MLAAVVLTLAAGWVTILSGLAIPLVTGLVTKLDASVGTKSIITIFLSAAAGIGATVVNEGGILTTDTLISALVTWGLALGSFYGIWSPFGTDARLAPDFGIGKV